MQDVLEKQRYNIVDDEAVYFIEPERLMSVNEKHDGKDLLKPVCGRLYYKPEDKRFIDARCICIQNCACERIADILEKETIHSGDPQ